MFMRHPYVEIILPFNKIDEYFLSALNSVLASEDVRIKILLLDDRVDCSSNLPKLPIGTYKILRTSTRGYGNAISEGLGQIDSEYFAVMNADDLIHPRRLINQILDLELKNADLSVGKIVKFNSSGKILTQRLGYLTKGEYTETVLLLGAYGADASWCGRTEKLKTWNISNELATDWITALENFSHLNVVYSPKAIYFYRQHESQLTKSEIFKQSSSQEIYNRWSLMNLNKGYRTLSMEMFKLVACPWLVTKPPNKESIREATVWLREFNQSTNRRYATLVYRRNLFLFCYAFKNHFLPIQNFIPAIFGAFNFLFETYLNIFRKILFKKFLNTK
jgi:glycosyltransferase involved in cell wall biosynthesis